MLRTVTIIAVLSVAASCLGATKMTVGKMAPDFELKGSDGKTYKLSSFKDKKAVVIAWYPRAFTGG